MNNEKKIQALSKQINEISARFDHDFVELADEGVDYDLIADTMEEELIYTIENIVTRFELKNPDIYIVGIQRQDGDNGYPEVILDWIDMTDKDPEPEEEDE